MNKHFVSSEEKSGTEVYATNAINNLMNRLPVQDVRQECLPSVFIFPAQQKKALKEQTLNAYYVADCLWISRMTSSLVALYGDYLCVAPQAKLEAVETLQAHRRRCGRVRHSPLPCCPRRTAFSFLGTVCRAANFRNSPSPATEVLRRLIRMNSFR